MGAVLYVLVAPGNLPAEALGNSIEAVEAPQTSYIDHIISIIPNNIVKPFLEGNVLSLLLLAFAVGIGLSKLPDSENKAVVTKGLLGIQDLLFLLIKWLIWTLPLGIVAFSAQLSAQVSAGVVADSIGKYVLVVLVGNVIQFFVVLPLFLLARGLNPVYVLGRMMPAVLMALFTKSSAATLPVTMETAENRLGVRKNIARFVLPYLHHNQHERLCRLYPRHFSLRDAEWWHYNHIANNTAVDSHLCCLSRRQCRSTYGVLFPHIVADVGCRGTNSNPRYHYANLHCH